MKDNVVPLRLLKGVCIECNMQKPDHVPGSARCKEEQVLQQRCNGDVAQMWALADHYARLWNERDAYSASD
jgi:hypothetical protein